MDSIICPAGDEYPSGMCSPIGETGLETWQPQTQVALKQEFQAFLALHQVFLFSSQMGGVVQKFFVLSCQLWCLAKDSYQTTDRIESPLSVFVPSTTPTPPYAQELSERCGKIWYFLSSDKVASNPLITWEVI